MRPFIYAFILIGLICLSLTSFTQLLGQRGNTYSPSEKVEAVEMQAGGFFNAIGLFFSSYLGTISVGDLLTDNDDSINTSTLNDGSKAPRWILKGLNFEQFLALGNQKSFFVAQSVIGRANLLWNLDINVDLPNYNSELYDASNFEYKRRNSMVVLHAENYVKNELKAKIGFPRWEIRPKIWPLFGRDRVTNPRRGFSWNRLQEWNYEKSMGYLNVAFDEPQRKEQPNTRISYLGKTIDLPLELFKVRTALNQEFYVSEKRIRELVPGSFTISEGITLNSPYQEFSLTYSNGEHELLDIRNTMIAVETLAPESIASLNPYTSSPNLLDSPPLIKNRDFKSSDALEMIRRSSKWSTNFSKRGSRGFFPYAKVNWQSPNNRIAKYVAILHRLGREKEVDYFGAKFSYHDIARYFSTPPIARNYEKWLDYVFAYGNKVQLADDSFGPTLIMHRSKPIYKDQRTTIFITTFSLVERNKKERRILLTGRKNETIYMISNTFADGLGENYLEEPIYTLTYDPMPSHPTWATPIRVTNFGVFIHSGEHAKRFAGCKGLTTHFDFKKRTTTKAIARRTMWQVKGLHDRLKIQRGKFLLMTDSQAPGSPPLPAFVKGNDPEALNMDWDSIIDENGVITPFMPEEPEDSDSPESLEGIPLIEENTTPEEDADGNTEDTENSGEEEKSEEEEKKEESDDSDDDDK